MIIIDDQILIDLKNKFVHSWQKANGRLLNAINYLE